MQKQEDDLSFRDFFVPLTQQKAVIWIIVIGLLVYFNALFNGFVWDDIIYIVNNPGVHSINFFSLVTRSIFNSGGQYRPIPAIYFATLYVLFGAHPFFYHLIQLALHIFNVVVLFFLFRRFFSKQISLLLSIVFLIHPIQVESVSFITASGNILFFSFGIVALVLNLKDRIGWVRFISTSLLILLSMLSKETGALFLIIIILYKTFFKHKTTASLIVSGLISLLTYFFTRFTIGNAESARSSFAFISTLPLLQRVIGIPKIFCYYITTALLPINLAIDQQWIVKEINFTDFYLPAFIDILTGMGIFAIGYLIVKRRQPFSTFIFFLTIFILGMSFHLQIFPLDMTVADRWFYFPFVGLLGLTGSLLSQIKLSGKKFQHILIFGYILIFLLSVRTTIRNADWVNNITLYSHDIRIYDNYQLEQNLGTEYYLRGDDKNFLYYTNRSISLFPNESNINNLAAFYLNHGDVHKAQYYLKKALTYNAYPKAGHDSIVATIYEELAWSYIYLEQFDNANKLIKSILPIYPSSAKLWAYLAIGEYELNNKSQALAAVEKANSLSTNAEIQYIYNQIVNNQAIKIK
jgi:hypothetical protein